MFGNLLGKASKDKSVEKEESEIVSRIHKMNLTDMRIYLKGNMAGVAPCEDGLNAIMDKLITIDENTLKRYIEIDDMDVKMKKGFDIVLLIAKNSKITVEIVEKIQNFITLYQDVILKFDTQNKQIYASKLNDALLLAINNVNTLSEMNERMNVLKN